MQHKQVGGYDKTLLTSSKEGSFDQLSKNKAE